MHYRGVEATGVILFSAAIGLLAYYLLTPELPPYLRFSEEEMHETLDYITDEETYAGKPLDPDQPFTETKQRSWSSHGTPVAPVKYTPEIVQPEQRKPKQTQQATPRLRAQDKPSGAALAQESVRDRLRRVLARGWQAVRGYAYDWHRELSAIRDHVQTELQTLRSKQKTEALKRNYRQQQAKQQALARKVQQEALRAMQAAQLAVQRSKQAADTAARNAQQDLPSQNHP